MGPNGVKKPRERLDEKKNGEEWKRGQKDFSPMHTQEVQSLNTLPKKGHSGGKQERGSQGKKGTRSRHPVAGTRLEGKVSFGERTGATQSFSKGKLTLFKLVPLARVRKTKA